MNPVMSASSVKQQATLPNSGRTLQGLHGTPNDNGIISLKAKKKKKKNQKLETEISVRRRGRGSGSVLLRQAGCEPQGSFLQPGLSDQRSSSDAYWVLKMQTRKLIPWRHRCTG